MTTASGIENLASKHIGNLGGIDLRWNAETTYFKNACVVHQGEIWVLLAAQSTGSEPADGNADWLRIVIAVGNLPAGLEHVSPCLSIGTTVANQLSLCGSTTGVTTTIAALGSDPNVSIQFVPQGAGTLDFQGTVTAVGSAIVGTAVANQVVVAGAATGDAVSISAAGSDTDVPLVAGPKGLGAFVVGDPAVADQVLADVNLPIWGLQGATVIAGVLSDATLVQITYSDLLNSQLYAVTGGTPGALTDTPSGTVVLIQKYAVMAGGGTEIGEMVVRALSSMGVYGSQWMFTGFDVAGSPGPFLSFEPTGTPTTTLGRAATVPGDLVVLDGANTTATGSMTVTTRTGTPAKFACFDSGGKLCDGEAVSGASGSFTTADAKTVTVVNGIITSIV